MIYAPARFATRFLLPMEVLLSWFSLGWAWAGLWGQGVFARVVAESGMGKSWMWVVVVWACCMLFAAVLESIFGRNWCDGKLRWSLEIRAHLGWIGLMLWVIIAFMMLSLPILKNVVSLTWALPAMVCGCASIGWYNAKVAMILNPNVPTECLKSRLLDERTRRLSQPR